MDLLQATTHAGGVSTPQAAHWASPSFLQLCLGISFWRKIEREGPTYRGKKE